MEERTYCRSCLCNIVTELAANLHYGDEISLIFHQKFNLEPFFLKKEQVFASGYKDGLLCTFYHSSEVIVSSD